MVNCLVKSHEQIPPISGNGKPAYWHLSSILTTPKDKIAYMESHGERIKIARLAAGLNQSELAAACEVTRAAVSQWENDSSKSLRPENLFAVSRATGYSARWLATGEGPRLLGPENIEPADIPTGRKVPLISDVQAGEWVEQYDHFAPGDAEDWIEAGSKVGSRAFALRVSGDSMTSPSPPSIPHGTIIIVDPDIDPVNGSLVVAKLTDTQGTTFKKLVIDGPNRYLKPLNTDYKPIPINGNCIIIGVVKSAVMQF